MLAAAIAQSLVVAAIVGGALALLLWRTAVQDFDLALGTERVCAACPRENCDGDIDDYHNPRLVPLALMFTSDEGKWIIKHSQVTPSAPVVFSRSSKSWAWLYERIHGAVVEQNRKQWLFDIPTDFSSDLVEDIYLVPYTNASTPRAWTCDIGSRGGVGKRVLSAMVTLNADFEGGETLTQISREEYAMQANLGMLWIINSFVIQKRNPVLSGTQYVLHYYVRRY